MFTRTLQFPQPGQRKPRLFPLSVERDQTGDKTKFSLVFLHRYNFEADTDDQVSHIFFRARESFNSTHLSLLPLQVQRLMEAFRSFKVGMLVDGKPNSGPDSSDSSLDSLAGMNRNTREEFFRRVENDSDDSNDGEISPREAPIERAVSPSRRKAKYGNFASLLI